MEEDLPTHRATATKTTFRKIFVTFRRDRTTSEKLATFECRSPIVDASFRRRESSDDDDRASAKFVAKCPSILSGSKRRPEINLFAFAA